ncbi:MAG TPA: hypothetical protein P5328_02175 [Candidatus Paceibacterota bacterium]|nr:hypothetical protein [Candidatus Paceibacterota bacterium]HRZ34441.1 hypothetical protein [Candidatus Paceibacterota bacterium]
MKSEEQMALSEPIEREIGIVNGEIIPANRLENQIRLAAALYRKEVDKDIDVSSVEARNETMIFWSGGGEKSFSKIYRDIENDPGFVTHARLAGDILNITVEDVLSYKEAGKLPTE